MPMNDQTMHALLDGIVDIAYLMDLNGKLIYVNSAVTEMGFRPEELVGLNVLELIYPDDRATVLQAFKKRKQGSKNTALLNIRLLKADGDAVPFEMKSRTITLENGRNGNGGEQKFSALNGCYILGTARDISDRAQLKQALEEFKNAPPGNAGYRNHEANSVRRLDEMLLLPGRQERLSPLMARAWATTDYESEVLNNKNFSPTEKNPPDTGLR